MKTFLASFGKVFQQLQPYDEAGTSLRDNQYYIIEKKQDICPLISYLSPEASLILHH
jgi:hypothetical protein